MWSAAERSRMAVHSARPTVCPAGSTNSGSSSGPGAGAAGPSKGSLDAGALALDTPTPACLLVTAQLEAVRRAAASHLTESNLVALLKEVRVEGAHRQWLQGRLAQCALKVTAWGML